MFKSKKLSRNKTKNRTLYENKNVLLSDDKGNITVYSTKSQKIIFKYNFYKKKYKKIKKDLNFIVENNIVYIGDNLGYLYALGLHR